MIDEDSANLTRFQDVLAEDYGINGVLEALPGEYDLNYRICVDGVFVCVLKVMRPGCKPDFIEMQCDVLTRLHQFAASVPVPRLVISRDGKSFVKRLDGQGQDRLIWCISLLPGEVYAHIRPHPLTLIRELGQTVGMLDHALVDFQHPNLTRSMKWNLLEAGWVRDRFGLVQNVARRATLESICDNFERNCLPILKKLKYQAIHNDLNDHNLLVSFGDEFVPRISGVIDFGDMILAPRVCELAIAGAYVVLGQKKPVHALAQLVAGFHQRNPIDDEELGLVFPLLLTRLAVSVVNTAMMKQTREKDPYVVVSERPAWDFLEMSQDLLPAVVLAQLRIACGKPVVPRAHEILESLSDNKGNYAAVLGVDLRQVPRVDLSVAGSDVPRNPRDMVAAEALHLGSIADASTTVSFYGEPRLLYTTDNFLDGRHGNSDRRTIHTGVDIFAPAGQPVCAPMDGVVQWVEDRSDRLDYGGLVILEHQTQKGDSFYTLYGHLNSSVTCDLKPGDVVKAGEAFAKLGNSVENGGWSPHLHFQMAVATQGMREDWLGVASPDEADLWTSVYPNPAVLLNLDSAELQYSGPAFTRLNRERGARFGQNLKLSYQNPCMFIRGWRHYLFDEFGRPYLDAYNNVPHVGHAHPRIAQVAARQLRNINTNTRYLHPAQVEFANALTQKLPSPLSVCFFVNSASEANEVALRLARAYTQGLDMIVPDHGYHGMTTGAIDISAYKFNGPGGGGPKDWVQVVSVPDTFRGVHKRSDPEAGAKYANDVDRAVDNIHQRGGKLAGFIAESFPSVGGQLIPPVGYLQCVYEKVRNAGGLCIADEVQTGLGRLGKHYWGFEQQVVVPDIVVLGKPLGNGHPVAALVTTPEIADAFVTGMEFFSTFGGSTLSCVIGKEVLAIVDDEGLQENARVTGEYLLQGLVSLKCRHPVIADVRGIGFFLGVELVDDNTTLNPATQIAQYVTNRLREHRILIGSDGPYDNVLKIRPPLTFGKDDADVLVTTLDTILNESPCRV